MTPLFAVVFAYLLFVFYLAYVALWAAKQNGKLAAAPLAVRVVAWSILGLALVLDVAFNVIVGSAIFMEPPEFWPPKKLTFTARCAKWRSRDGYRARFARWVCEGWLNPFQEHHC